MTTKVLDFLPFQGMDPYDYVVDMDNYIETQSRIMTSETLALETIRSMGLTGNPEFAGGGSDAIATGSLKNQKLPSEVATLLGGLSVHHIPNTSLMQVSFESTDPQLAARILNAHLENYIAQNYRSRYETAEGATKWLQSELDELSVRMRRSEDARIQYERNNQIWAVDDKNNVTTQRLADLNKELTDAQSDTLKKQALYEFAKAGELDAVPQLRDNGVLQEYAEESERSLHPVHGCRQPVWSQFSKGAAAAGADKSAG